MSIHLMDFQSKLLDLQRKLKSKKEITLVTIYGSYTSPIKEILQEIRDALKSEGYAAGLVEDYPNNTGSHELNADQKSLFYIDCSNVNILYFFKNTDNQSVSREANHILDHPHLIGTAIFFEEKEPHEEFGAIKSLLSTRLLAKNIRVTPFNRSNVIKLTKKTLIDFIY